jgi:hypothetical protein
VFRARYALSPYIKQIRFVFKGLNRLYPILLQHTYYHGLTLRYTLQIWSLKALDVLRCFLGIVDISLGSVPQPEATVPCSCAPRVFLSDAVPNRITSERTLRLMPGARSVGSDGQGSSEKGKQRRSIRSGDERRGGTAYWMLLPTCS